MTNRTWDDIQSRLDARRVPEAKPALTFTGEPLAYWREEVALGCAVSLARLRRIVSARGADYELTLKGLKGTNQ